MESCISPGLPPLRAQPLENGKPHSLPTWALVMACRRRRLKRLPSVLYLMSVHGLGSWKASVCMAVNIILKSVGASKQPCFTKLAFENVVDDSPSSNCRTIWMKCFGHPDFMIFQRPFQQMPLWDQRKWYSDWDLVLGISPATILLRTPFCSISICPSHHRWSGCVLLIHPVTLQTHCRLDFLNWEMLSCFGVSFHWRRH